MLEVPLLVCGPTVCLFFFFFGSHHTLESALSLLLLLEMSFRVSIHFSQTFSKNLLCSMFTPRGPLLYRADIFYLLVVKNPTPVESQHLLRPLSLGILFHQTVTEQQPCSFYCTSSYWPPEGFSHKKVEATLSLRGS